MFYTNIITYYTNSLTYARHLCIVLCRRFVEYTYIKPNTQNFAHYKHKTLKNTKTSNTQNFKDYIHTNHHKLQKHMADINFADNANIAHTKTSMTTQQCNT